jgi:hypothetical protein
MALLVVALRWVWERPGIGKPLVALTIVGFMGVASAGAVQRMRLDGWRHYANAVAYLKSHAGPNDFIVGSEELGFLLGFTPNFRDDWQLGVTHGRQPRFLFMEEIYDGRYKTKSIQDTPEYPAVVERLKEYKPVFADQNFRVLERLD